MSEFTELLDAYTKLKADYDELKAKYDELKTDYNEVLNKGYELAIGANRLEEAAHNRHGLIIDGVEYIPRERATIVQLPNGMRIGEPIYDVISEGA